MSPAYKPLAVLAWLACSCVPLAQAPVSEPECADDVCVSNVIAANLIFEPCVGYSVLIAYSKSSGATLIQCSDPASEQNNQSFVYDRQHGAAKSFEFLGGRFIRPGYLASAQTGGIPDKFGPVPLCASKNRRAASRGELLIIEKQPNDSGTNPYCYRVNYVNSEKGSLIIRSDEGNDLSPLSDQAAKKWAKLQTTLRRYVAVGPTPGRTKSSEHR